MVQPAKSRTPAEVLAGLVDRVTFHNSESGFCVLRVKARGQRDLITVIGHAAMISAGEFVQASGGSTTERMASSSGPRSDEEPGSVELEK
jgi:exodeoxyribonuclease V alpha subunit